MPLRNRTTNTPSITDSGGVSREPAKKLDDDFVEELRDGSGLREETIRDTGWYTENDPNELARLLNWRSPPPCLNAGGHVITYKDLQECNGPVIVKLRVPRSPKRKYDNPFGQPNCLYLPKSTRDKIRAGADNFIVVEGAKKAERVEQWLRDAERDDWAAVGVSGKTNWVSNHRLLPMMEELAKRGGSWKICFDYDEKEKSRKDTSWEEIKLAAALRRAGAGEVKRVELPAAEGGGKNGADDHLVANGDDAFEHLVDCTKDIRPLVMISTREDETNDEAVECLAGDRSVFQRGGLLVHIIRPDRDEHGSGLHRPAGAPRIVPMPQALLRERLAANCVFQIRDPRRKRNKTTHPPRWCVEAIHARGMWPGIRSLLGVVDVPMLKPDGTILEQRGYDAETSLVYLPGCKWPGVPAHPTKEQVDQAVDMLSNLVADFPFKEPHHRSAFVAYPLTALARHAFDGPAPLFLVDSNVPGSGKGLLCSVTSIIVLGSDAPVSVSHGGDEAELRKSITAAAIAGDQLIVLDNVSGMLGGSALEAVLTTTRWKDRLLGHNVQVDLPMRATWAATGNNIMLGSDGAARRVVQIRLESPEERPEDRSGFKHPDLRAYARAHRGELLAACLTILRGYCAAGRPDMGLTPWGSYEAWSSLVRNATVWAGLDDPGLTRNEIRQTAVPELEAVPALFDGIQRLDPKGHGITVNEMIQSGDSELHNALCVLCPSKDGKVSPRSVGMKLHHLCGRVVGGKCLQRLKGHDGTRWKVVGTEAGTTGTRGTSPSPVPKKCKSIIRVATGTSPVSPASPASPAGSSPLAKALAAVMSRKGGAA